ncbi:TetR family transcriptional regulator [Dermabacter hominis]|uniref:TetR family transcriptional regulator n=1 Tax=Dermabacter hominis TaxID=36740 RepID=UPI000ADC8B9E
MRTSKRDSILQAALHVVETDGVTAVTYESVAAASGLTKGGLLYHFPSKDALVLALHEHLAERWDHEMINVLGKDPDEATQDERVTAYARVSARSATGPELLLMLEASTDSELNKPWRRVISRWIPDPAEIDPTDPRALQKMVVYLAADGLWLSESVGAAPFRPNCAPRWQSTSPTPLRTQPEPRATRRTDERIHLVDLNRSRFAAAAFRLLKRLLVRGLVESVPYRGTPAGQLRRSSLLLPIGSVSPFLRHICRTGYTPSTHPYSETAYRETKSSTPSHHQNPRYISPASPAHSQLDRASPPQKSAPETPPRPPCPTRSGSTHPAVPNAPQAAPHQATENPPATPPASQNHRHPSSKTATNTPTHAPSPKSAPPSIPLPHVPPQLTPPETLPDTLPAQCDKTTSQQATETHQAHHYDNPNPDHSPTPTPAAGHPSPHHACPKVYPAPAHLTRH